MADSSRTANDIEDPKTAGLLRPFSDRKDDVRVNVRLGDNDAGDIDDNSELKRSPSFPSSSVVLSMARRLEAVRVPKKPCRLFGSSKRGKPTSPANEEDNDNAKEEEPVEDDEEYVPLISGLESVVVGTSPASQSVRCFGGTIRLPQYLWYSLSGLLCDVVQLVIDLVLHYGLQIQDASTCWCLSFALSVTPRHTSHRYLVFGSYVGGYWNSLGRMYAGYSVIILLSTAFHYVLDKYVFVKDETTPSDVTHYMSFVITLLWTGIVNYFILKKLWSFGGKR